MLKFRQAVERGQKGLEKEKVAENMPGVPSVVTDSLLARFTEVARGSTRYYLLNLSVVFAKYPTFKSYLYHNYANEPADPHICLVLEGGQFCH